MVLTALAIVSEAVVNGVHRSHAFEFVLARIWIVLSERMSVVQTFRVHLKLHEAAAGTGSDRMCVKKQVSGPLFEGLFLHGHSGGTNGLVEGSLAKPSERRKAVIACVAVA